MNRNTFVSPLSIFSALSLALVGSAGKLRSEMLAALKLDTEEQDFDAIVRSVGDGLKKVPEGDVKNTLVQINAMFVEGSMAVLPVLVTDKVDRIHAAEEARKTINSWVEANTANKMKDLFPPNSLDHMTRMVLVNAVYFKGKSVQTVSSE